MLKDRTATYGYERSPSRRTFAVFSPSVGAGLGDHSGAFTGTGTDADTPIATCEGFEGMCTGDGTV